MPSIQFNAALAQLSDIHRETATSTLDGWKAMGGGSGWSQIAGNIENETALSDKVLASLLMRWVEAVRSGVPPDEAWITACRDERKAGLLGRPLTETESPALLGRAQSLKNYALYAGRKIKMSPGDIQDILLSCPDGDLPRENPDFCELLRECNLGGEVIWATFNEADPSNDPFDGYPDDSVNVCTTLGLQPGNPPEIMILLSYEREAYAAEPHHNRPYLHRPTIAEACNYPLFRPWSDPDHPYGYTWPTPPNSGGVGGRPEVVHQEITSKGLRYPYRLSHT